METNRSLKDAASATDDFDGGHQRLSKRSEIVLRISTPSQTTTATTTAGQPTAEEVSKNNHLQATSVSSELSAKATAEAETAPSSSFAAPPTSGCTAATTTNTNTNNTTDKEGLAAYVNVTVKFRLSETSEVIAQVYPNCMLIGELKKDLARKFEVNARRLCLSQCDRQLAETCALRDTCHDVYGIHELTLALAPACVTDGNETVTSIEEANGYREFLDLNVYYEKYRLPDFITVHIAGEDSVDGQPRNIVVEIENKSIVKPFLCGYRHKQTGVEYVDAFTQTGPWFDKWKHRRYVTRDTQTHEHKVKLIDTMHDQTSQCFLDKRNVLYVSEAPNEPVIVPRKYQTYAQKTRLEQRLAKIKLIQRNWRRVLVTRFIRNCAQEYRRLVANRKAEDVKHKVDVERRLQREHCTKQFPRTRDDFDVLFSEVQKWKIAELKRIASMYEGAARIAEVHLLLDKEIQLLNGIERQRTVVFNALQDFRDDQLLKDLGKPITWVGYKDNVIHLDLLRTQRVRFLTEIFNDLRQTVTKTERLHLLKKVKEVLMDECEFPEFTELFDLFDREKNLLLYTQHCDVEVLRKRQNLLFLALIKFSKDKPPTEPPKLMCTVCNKVKSCEQFAVRTRQNVVDTCKHCHNLKTSASDNTVYTAILRSIQREERKKRCNASFAFVMQMDDIRFIIDKIWHRHSILSKLEDLNMLRLPRWRKAEDWSPWNCVCLTEDEARDHYSVDQPQLVYDQKMVQEVGNRHKLARRAFQKLAAVATEFLETGDWWRSGLNKQRLPPQVNALGASRETQYNRVDY